MSITFMSMDTHARGLKGLTFVHNFNIKYSLLRISLKFTRALHLCLWILTPGGQRVNVRTQFQSEIFTLAYKLKLS